MRDNTKIVVSGFYRTGTTHAYNLTKSILDEAKVCFSFMGASLDRLFDCIEKRQDLIVIKSHETYVDSEDAIRVVFCIRNPVDTIASNIRISNSTIEKANIDDIIKGFNKHKEWADKYRKQQYSAVLDYDKLYFYPDVKVKRIARLLGIELTDKQIRNVIKKNTVKAAKKIIKGLSNDPGNKADPDSQLRWQHIGPHNGEPYAYDFPEELRKEILEKCNW